MYRTRPDRLGFGRDHSPGANGRDTQQETTELASLLEPAHELIQQLADAVAAAERVPRRGNGVREASASWRC